MASSLDMSLDDRTKNRSNRGRGRGCGRDHPVRGQGRTLSGRRMTGAVLRGSLMVNARPSSYAIAKACSKKYGCLYMCLRIWNTNHGRIRDIVTQKQEEIVH